MADNQALFDEIKTKLIPTYDPEEIYIFGRYAWGHPDQDDDVEILVVVKQVPTDISRYKIMARGYKVLMDLEVPKCLLVYTKSEFDQYASNITTLCYEVKHRGKRIYAHS